ncbi:efflux RND transporter periplasmic adaptor subunit [Shewanella sp. D64]|uniref:efflux RND transporter periplasmic adaptor subunit n=1 Tax=unclassified Shewanella TaxID=196818 RepID=UPI0022BA1441|nr:MULTISPECIES: efflux RND transporter periplasmic adaptor subunit [unclassified Shewanella]MEC4726572.1 efflux RND transporter periplasmic adaptor subunit [Shewanella sp. D64]MEC4737387.1 efflux RND transporter periplasmic adaptor subunit [Shewanella sp. E94]WBJ97207.1 efflux RND transporter periplasmic adaptor subunit [Shewanella sp. MTB7]
MSIITDIFHNKILVSTLFIGLLTACQGEVANHSNQIKFQTVTTETLTSSASYQHAQEFTGTIRAGNTTGIGFELAGKLKKITVDSGDQVETGQLLAQLDTRLLEAERQEIDASLAQNNADLNLAKSTLDRSLELQKQGYTSEQQLDELKGQLNSLLAAKNKLIASKHANVLRIEKSSLLAPFSGVISKRNSNLGEVVALGTPIFTLVQDKNPQAFVGVPIKIAQQLKTKQHVQLNVGNRNYTAQIAGIGAEVNPVTRTVPLRLSLPIDAQVINGELAYLVYEIQIQQVGYWVPISALTDGIRGLWNLYVITPNDRSDISAAEDTFSVERRDIEILYTKDDMAYIQGALQVNESYISQGLHKLVVGQQVKHNTSVAAR